MRWDPQLYLLFFYYRKTQRTVKLTWKTMKKTTMIWKMRAFLSHQLSPVEGSENLSPWMRVTMISDLLGTGARQIKTLRFVGKQELRRLGGTYIVH